MVDFDALAAAGIADARGRAGLIEYLDSLGFTAEEMVEAERHGRLFGLAGDALQWSGRQTYTPRAAAEHLGVALADVERAWAALGLTAAKPDELALSQADIDALATWVDLKKFIGDERALGLLRVIGATLGRLAEAQSAVVRAGWPEIQLEHTHDELATAKAYRAIAEFIPRTGAMIDTLLRHHLVGARTHFEGVIRDTSESVMCGVGFADLSGFTALTQRLTPTELSELLVEFSGAVSDVVHADGGRVVKFIGDEVMWVTSTPELLMKVAVDLVEHPRARETGLHVRAGLGFGSVLAIGGDYFGTPVNLAARLVGAAAPGQILAAAGVREELPDWPATRLDPLTLKGFDGPVTAYDLHVGG
ncbi:adenylate/guanylate cyclase domain-containing protein [Mycobacterium deserti]|uniref:Adenylate/guanylate cyclase domain-containing protein n=1 Tax=Mycobacterium deserti TaxID=2978347 RepID=A0ABT2MD81_9MYCO|nr:adenylate/guanylate cyclase domain-containing protein [Mycobacterium deserti]MCT7660227.1 adenylate/guanylate cyclase domain-containing protein [Mycobacterium deserti]